MTKRRFILAWSLAAALFATPGPALAQQGDPVYSVYYFSDETEQQHVGTYHGDCTYWGPVMYAWLEGQTSAHSQQVLVGYCYQGIWQPL